MSIWGAWPDLNIIKNICIKCRTQEMVNCNGQDLLIIWVWFAITENDNLALHNSTYSPNTIEWDDCRTLGSAAEFCDEC